MLVLREIWKHKCTHSQRQAVEPRDVPEPWARRAVPKVGSEVRWRETGFEVTRSDSDLMLPACLSILVNT